MQINERIYLVGSEQFGLSHALDCNCYLVDGGTQLALVDTGLGLGVEDILANIAAHGFDPKKLTHIILTHAHPGHWGGGQELVERTGAKVYAPAQGVAIMLDVDNDPGVRLNMQKGRYPAGFKPNPCATDVPVHDGDTIRVGDLELRAILTQGHTKDSTCYLVTVSSKRALFTGDTVFYAGKLGIINLEGFSLDDYRRDICKLADLNVDSMLPGHSVFIVRNGQKHIQRAIHKLSDFVMPETFFEGNEFLWEKDYRPTMVDQA